MFPVNPRERTSLLLRSFLLLRVFSKVKIFVNQKEARDLFHKILVYTKR